MTIELDERDVTRIAGFLDCFRDELEAWIEDTEGFDAEHPHLCGSIASDLVDAFEHAAKP
jgi:hypothetical protein